MNKVQKLQIKALANMFLPTLVEKHGCGFFDGGCATFATAVHNAFPSETKLVAAISKDGRIQHVLVGMSDGNDLYGDAAGWHTEDEFKSFFRKTEGIEIHKLISEPIDIKFLFDVNITIFNDVAKMITTAIVECRDIEFELPVDDSDSIRVSCGMFDSSSASVTSSYYKDCEGIPGGFVDGIESMILGQFCAGVDVTSPEYCEGILSALQAAVNGLCDCKCVPCLKENAEVDEKVLIHRSRRAHAIINESSVYSADSKEYQKTMEDSGDDIDHVFETFMSNSRIEKLDSDSDVIEIVAEHQVDFEEL